MSSEVNTMPPSSALAQQAYQYFTEGRYDAALQIYQQLGQRFSNALIDHGQALCLIGMGRMSDALVKLNDALDKDGQHAASALMKGRLLTHLGRAADAQALFSALADDPVAGIEARADLALLQLSDLGDPVTARQMLEPLLTAPGVAKRAQAAWWVSNLYDRDISALQLTQYLHRFVREHLQPQPAELQRIAQLKQSVPARRFTNRRRIGIVSPVLCASPVYFLTFSTLSAMTRHADLVFYDRSEKPGDWATSAFQTIGHTWRRCPQFQPLQLAELMVRDQLDAVIDLGGWMDWGALQALMLKPAPRQIKWVGGQSTSTAMACFDGFVCDQWHVPEHLTYLYSEPLIFISGGYADYHAPGYLPKPVPFDARSGGYGVIANPNKLSRSFMVHLAQTTIPDALKAGTALVFIERRYQDPVIKQRVITAIRQAGCADVDALLAANQIRFMAPSRHVDFLAAIGQLHYLIDTFPYSSGLTAVEAAALGVEILSQTGELFCERHSFAIGQKYHHAGGFGVEGSRGSFISQQLIEYL